LPGSQQVHDALRRPGLRCGRAPRSLRRNAEVREQSPGHARVLGRDHVRAPQHLERRAVTSPRFPMGVATTYNPDAIPGFLSMSRFKALPSSSLSPPQRSRPHSRRIPRTTSTR
jgi:hypothetical protein